MCVSGASPESVSRLLAELAQYGTYYLRLSRFSLQSSDKKGLVFQVCLRIIINTTEAAEVVVEQKWRGGCTKSIVT